MTPTELRQLIQTVGWTQAQAAQRIGIGERHLRKLLAGEYPIPLALCNSVNWAVTNTPKALPAS